MKTPVQIVVQPFLDNSYWINDIIVGIKSICDTINYYPRVIIDENINFSEMGLNNSCVIVVGYDVSWLHKTINSLQKICCKTIVVNSWVSEDLLKSNNAVYFTLDSIIEQACTYLSMNKREKTVLFGINERSLADFIKKDTFIQLNKSLKKGDVKVYSFKDSLSKSLNDFLQDFSEGNIDSVICANDTIAICLQNMLKKEGFKIPEDLFVIGMGNSELGKYVSPSITTFEFDYFELGKQTFWLWKSLIKDDKDTHREVKLICPFIIRESTENLIYTEKDQDRLEHQNLKMVIENDMNAYFEDETIKTVINFETFFRSCDKQDISILKGIVKNKNYNLISESLFMTDRAIRYRINKMNKKLGISTREEMVKMIKSFNIFEDEE